MTKSNKVAIQGSNWVLQAFLITWQVKVSMRLSKTVGVKQTAIHCLLVQKLQRRDTGDWTHCFYLNQAD